MRILVIGGSVFLGRAIVSFTATSSSVRVPSCEMTRYSAVCESSVSANARVDADVQLAPTDLAGLPVVLTAKGLEQGSLKRQSEVLAEAADEESTGDLPSGGVLAREFQRFYPDRALRRGIATAVGTGNHRRCNGPVAGDRTWRRMPAAPGFASWRNASRTPIWSCKEPPVSQVRSWIRLEP